MIYSTLVGPAVTAAVIAGMISVIGILLQAKFSRQISKSRMEFEEKLSSDRVKAEMLTLSQKAQNDRDATLFFRVADATQEFLADAYEMKSLILSHRRVGLKKSPEEGEDLSPMPADSESMRVSFALGILDHLSETHVRMLEMQSKKYKFACVLGKEVMAVYDGYSEVRGRLVLACQSLIEAHQAAKHLRDAALISDWQRVISLRPAEDDEIQKHVDSLINEAEQICERVSQKINALHVAGKA